MRQDVRPRCRSGVSHPRAGRLRWAGALMLVAAILPGALVAQEPSEARAASDVTAGSAIPNDPGLLRRSAPAVAASPAVAAEVRVRLDEDLGEWTDAVRSAVLASPSARIAEPAEVELRTRRNFPLTLQLANAWESPELWQIVFADDDDPAMPMRMPRTIELGNLVLEDYAAPLRVELDRLGRVNALLSAASTAGQARTVTCFVPRADTPVSPTCDVPVRTRGAGAAPQSPIDTSEPVRFAVGNRGPRPQHVALLFVDSDKRVVQVPLPGDGPLAPGAWAQSDGGTTIGNRGAYWLVTLASEQPLAIDPSRVDLVLREGVSITVSQGELHHIPIEPIGGGLEVPDFRAPWIAEFYSTVPYTKVELDADDAKPEAEREYLRKRSPGERAHRCGGTLIAPDLVVTAAHCVAKGGFAGDGAAAVLKTRRVRLGSLELGKGGATYAIDAMAVHGAYRPEQTPHDIALLRLKPDRDSTYEAGKPITLLAGRDASPPLQAGVPIAAYGWGYTGVVAPQANPLFTQGGELQRNPGKLQMGELEAQGWKDCRKRMGDDLGPRMLCAVSRKDPGTGQAPRHVFSCRGDSGGPLVREVGGQEMLVGVASWSRGCGYGDYPSVYTDVSRYAAWLELARQKLRSGEVARVNEQPAARASAD